MYRACVRSEAYLETNARAGESQPVTDVVRRETIVFVSITHINGRVLQYSTIADSRNPPRV